MKVLLPAVSPDDVHQLKALAPDAEFYAGIELAEWFGAFGKEAELNRMSAFGKTANLSGLESIRALCSAAEGNDLYLTLNAPSYNSAQLSFLDSLLGDCMAIGLSGIIIGDPMLAGIVRKHGLKAVASTMIGVYNEDIAKWCIEQGFQRLILPRDLTLDEIGEIMVAAPQVEYECFLMRNGCRYSDSYCLARHKNRFGALCTYLDRSKVSICGASEHAFTLHDEALFNHHVFSQAFHKSACGLCAIWRFLQMGISAGKVVGRADGVASIKKDTDIILHNIKIASEAESEEAYLSRMVYPSIYDTACYQGLNCYYPEVRYP